MRTLAKNLKGRRERAEGCAERVWDSTSPSGGSRDPTSTNVWFRVCRRPTARYHVWWCRVWPCRAASCLVGSCRVVPWRGVAGRAVPSRVLLCLGASCLVLSCSNWAWPVVPRLAVCCHIMYWSRLDWIEKAGVRAQQDYPTYRNARLHTKAWRAAKVPTRHNSISCK